MEGILLDRGGGVKRIKRISDPSPPNTNIFLKNEKKLVLKSQQTQNPGLVRFAIVALDGVLGPVCLAPLITFLAGSQLYGACMHAVV